MDITVIICAHNPDPGRLFRTFDALRVQTLLSSKWNCVLVDNASTAIIYPSDMENLRVVEEPQMGLSFARRRGLREASGSLCIFVDDDNVLDPNYLEWSLKIAMDHPRIGMFGGRVQPEFEVPVADWQHEFLGLLAVRDLGEFPIIASSRAPIKEYPSCAPIGAGMVLRREAAQAWLDAPQNSLTDRCGGNLTSGGDNDIVLTLIEAGWDAAYFPGLTLTHLIPSSRLVLGYLGRLNEDVQRSWIRVLSLHGLCPWSAIAPWTVSIRSARAWVRHRAWVGPAQYVRWRGAKGHFLGLADIDLP